MGEDVVVIGHPRGMQWTLTAGKVSQFRGVGGGTETVYLQTDAAANPGNSGGPILNLRGFVVGVVTSKLEASEGMTFGIYRDVAQAFVRRFR